MAVVKPVLDVDEAFFPSDESGTNGRIVKLYELRGSDGKTLVNMNQFGAIRAAQSAGGYVLSIAEDIAARVYAKAHRDDPELNAYYDGVNSRIRYSRFTRTQVHGLMSDSPFVVNVSRVHPEHDLVLEYESKVISVPWLPKKSGYVQELDIETGLPRSVGSNPNADFDNMYFYFDPSIDIVVAGFGAGSGRAYLYCVRFPQSSNAGLGVRLAKDFSAKTLEGSIA